jgi:hypothetical protein
MESSKALDELEPETPEIVAPAPLIMLESADDTAVCDVDGTCL